MRASMFDRQSLEKIKKLSKVFLRKDTRFMTTISSWGAFKRIAVAGRDDLRKFVEDGNIKNSFNITATSGSTSSRLTIVHSREAYEAHLKRLVKIYRLIGVKKGTLCLNLCSYELNSGGRLMEAGLKAAGAGVIPLGPISSPQKIQEAVDFIKTLKPDLINAYTNQLYDLFSVLEEKHSVKRCLVNGEPLWPSYRKRIEKMGSVDVHDHYGTMEISGLAVALKPDDVDMRVVSDGLLLEILQDSGEISKLGTGALLVTDLNNTSMPFIRYRLGDRVELKRRQGVLWIKILGRTEDSLLINGVVVSKHELIRTVNDIVGHPRFFFVLDKHKLQYCDKLFINVVDGDSQKFQFLEKTVINQLGLDQCVQVRCYHGEIPRTVNGKIKSFLDARKKA